MPPGPRPPRPPGPRPGPRPRPRPFPGRGGRGRGWGPWGLPGFGYGAPSYYDDSYPTTIEIHTHPDDEIKRILAYIATLPIEQRAAAVQHFFGNTGTTLGADAPATPKSSISTGMLVLGVGIAAYLLFFRKK